MAVYVPMNPMYFQLYCNNTSLSIKFIKRFDNNLLFYTYHIFIFIKQLQLK